VVEKGRVVEHGRDMVERERALAEKREVERRRRKRKKKRREKSFFQFNSIIHENCIYMFRCMYNQRIYNQRIL